jgi:hypothetical protein
VIESPKATTVPAGSDDRTSRPVTNGRAVTMSVKAPPSASAARSPVSGGVRYEVWRATGCWVWLRMSSGPTTLTATVSKGSTAKATGSLTTSSPGSTVTDDSPSKARSVIVSATDDAPVARRAMVTWSKVTAASP